MSNSTTTFLNDSVVSFFSEKDIELINEDFSYISNASGYYFEILKMMDVFFQLLFISVKGQITSRFVLAHDSLSVSMYDVVIQNNSSLLAAVNELHLSLLQDAHRYDGTFIDFRKNHLKPLFEVFIDRYAKR